jgi:hypothetical protein
LLNRAITRLRQEYAAQNKATVFETLKIFLGSGGEELGSYEDTAKVLGVSLGAAKTLIHRLRKRYTFILREEVGRTVSDPAEVDGEIHALCDALIAAGGRLGP